MVLVQSLSDGVDGLEVHWDVLFKYLLSFSYTPTTFRTTMFFSLLFFPLSGVPVCFVALFVDFMKAQLVLFKFIGNNNVFPPSVGNKQ